MKLSNYPKLYCPFERQIFKVNKDDYKKIGNKLGLRSPEVKLVVDKIKPGYEWVFEDKETIAVEKLDGTNVKIFVENERLLKVQNRLNIIDPLQIIKGKQFIMNGIFNSVGKGYVGEGEQVGELIGPKVQGNPYKLDIHLWYPFTKTIKHLKYNCFHEHERTFNNWNFWFKDWLFSRFYTKLNTDKIMAEGVVFYNLKRKSENKIWRAKLRRNMFLWYYKGIEIYGYNKNGITI